MRRILMFALVVVAAGSASAGPADVGALVPGDETLTGTLWRIAADEDFAAGFLDAVGPAQLALADTLMTLTRMTEPELRELLPDMYVIVDFGPPLDERPPDWAAVRYAAVRWLGRIAAAAGEFRDARLVDELEAAMAGVGRPQRAEVGGLVVLLEDWWADRGLDPRLTHHPQVRDPAARAFREAEGQGPRPGLSLLLAMDRDPIVRERLLDRLDRDHSSWLVADVMLVVDLDADSLVALGVPPRTWDAKWQRARGHNVPELRRLAMDLLDEIAPAVPAGPDDFSRRLSRSNWWRAARYEARYWADPLEAPDFAPFLTGLRIPESEGGRPVTGWVRWVHLQHPTVQRRIREQLDASHRPIVAELLGLSQLDREAAAKAGFSMYYRRRPLSPSEKGQEVTVAIDWAAVRELSMDLLEAITGEKPPRVLAAAPELRSDWWVDWWADQRNEGQWYRGDLPEGLVLPERKVPLDLKPERSRVD